MAVYVDRAYIRHKGREWCHMTADTLEELHQAAASIGMRRSWFQCPPKASMPHYDVTRYKRAQAVVNGAIEVNNFEGLAKAQKLWVEFMQAHDPSRLSVPWPRVT